MASGAQIPLQSFTRVHLVPRVNGTAAAALVFERQDQEALALSLPLEVMGQIFGVLPQVMAQSAEPPSQAASAPVRPTAPWALEGFALETEGEQIWLVLRVGGVQVQLQMDAALMTDLAQGLTKATKTKASRAPVKSKLPAKEKTALEVSLASVVRKTNKKKSVKP